MNQMTIKDFIEEIKKGLEEEQITEDSPIVFHLLQEGDDNKAEPLIPKNMFMAKLSESGEYVLGFNFLDRQGAIQYVLGQIRGGLTQPEDHNAE